MTVDVSAANGTYLGNVSVEGLMLVPQTVGNGYTPVFYGMTNLTGTYSVSNWAYIDMVSQYWEKYTGNNNGFAPYVTVFMTYNESGSVYTQQTSIPMTPAKILAGESYRAFAQMNFTSKHLLVPDRSVQGESSFWSADSSAGIFTPDQNFSLPTPSPTLASDGMYVWEETNSTTIGTINEPLQIPLAVADMTGTAEAEVGDSIFVASQDVTGNILNPFDPTSVQTTVGAQSGSNSFSSNLNWNDEYASGWSYTYIEGALTITNFKLYFEDNGYFMSMGSYQTVVGISYINTTGGLITNPVGIGEPIDGMIQADYTWTPYTTPTPTNDSSGNKVYTVNSAMLYQTVSNYDQLAGTVIAAGSIILAVAALSNPAGLAAVTAGIVLSALGVVPIVIQWGSYSTAYAMSAVKYITTNGVTPTTAVDYSDLPLTFGSGQVNVPVTTVYAYGQPSSSGGGGGGGGCVLNGTLISTARNHAVPVQDLRVGDQILTYDTASGKLVKEWVTDINVTRNVTQIMDINNGMLYASGFGDQPIYVMLPNGNAEWIMLGNLTTSDQLFDPLNDTWTPITSISVQSGHFTVYEVSGSKAFYSDGYVRSTYIGNGVLLDKKPIA